MNFGICYLSVIPMRAEPSDRSEQVNQILFGEFINYIGQRSGSFIKVRLLHDHYEGWVDEKQIQFLNDEVYHRMNGFEAPVCLDPVNIVWDEAAKKGIPVLMGSSLPNLQNGKFYVDQMLFTFEGEYSVLSQKATSHTLLENARVLLGAPYQWGGRSVFGIDCSGFTQLVFKTVHINILRDASQQSTLGETINFVDEAHPGDLIFFDNDDFKIIHVGIYMGNNKIIHAHGQVRIDTIDHHGIFNECQQKYSHKLRIIKRIM